MRADVIIEGDEESLEQIAQDFREPDEANGSTIRYNDIELGDAMRFVKKNEVPTESWDIRPRG